MMTDEQRQARDLWAVGIRGSQIAHIVGVQSNLIWTWRAKFNWPKRRARDHASPQVKMAAKLWAEDVPRSTIAALAGVSLSTVDDWKQFFRWPRRKPGLRADWRHHQKARFQQMQATAMGRSAKRMQAAIEKVRQERATLIRWRCDCGILRQDVSCLVCQRKHPLCP